MISVLKTGSFFQALIHQRHYIWINYLHSQPKNEMLIPQYQRPQHMNIYQIHTHAEKGEKVEIIFEYHIDPSAIMKKNHKTCSLRSLKRVGVIFIGVEVPTSKRVSFPQTE